MIIYTHICVCIYVKDYIQLKFLSVFKDFLCRNEAVVWELFCLCSCLRSQCCGSERAHRRAVMTMQAIESWSQNICTKPQKYQSRCKNASSARVSELRSLSPVTWLTCTLPAPCCPLLMNLIGVECGKSPGPTSSFLFDIKGSLFLPALSHTFI